MEQKTNFKEFCNAAEKIAILDAKLNNRKVDENFLKNLKVCAAGIFKIVVMGEIKKGKSSLINSIVGVKDLVPTASDVATSTVYKICYGSEIKYNVFFVESAGKPPLVITKDELSDYGTEKGNPNNEKGVDFIQVFVPSPVLKGGLVIIDTPGLGGLFKQHKRITYEYVPKADGVFLVCDSIESPLGIAEINLLKDIEKITNNVCVIQTKANAVDSQARNARRDNNRQILENAGFGNLKYFVVDSHLRFEADETKDIDDLEASGYPALLHFVNSEIKGQVQKLLVSRISTTVAPIVSSAKSELETRKSILSADSESKREEIKTALEQAGQQIADFQQNVQPQIFETLQRGLREIRESVDEKISELRPAGAICNGFEQRINAAESITELSEELESIQSEVPEILTNSVKDCQKIIQDKVVGLVGQIEEKCREIDSNKVKANAEFDSTVNVGMAKKVQLDKPKFSINGYEVSFDTIRNAAFGAFTGGTVTSILWPTIALFTIVSTGLFLGAGIFAAWTGYSIKKKKDDDLKMAKNSYLSQLLNSMSLTTANVQKKIAHIISEVEMSLNSSIRKAVTDAQNNLLRRRNDLNEQTTRSIQETAAKKSELAQYEAEYRSLVNVLKNAR